MQRTGFVLLLVWGLIACDEAPGVPSAPCVEHRDCAGDYQCVAGSCEPPEDTRVRIDAGSLHPDAQSWGLIDAGQIDSGVQPDAGFTPDQGVEVDMGAPDSGVHPDAAASADSGTPADTGVEVDMGTPDSGVHPDAMVPPDSGTQPDAGQPVGPVARGNYSYRRVLVPGIPTTTGFQRIAMSPDGSKIVVGAYYQDLWIVDRATETSSSSLMLMRNGANSVRIDDIEYSPAGNYFLIAATAITNGNYTGRLYRAGPSGQNLSLIGSAPGVEFQAITFDAQSGIAYIGGYRNISGNYVVNIHQYNHQTKHFTLLNAQSVTAGCQDIALSADGLGGKAVVYSCGVGGGDLGHLDSTGAFNQGPRIGNVSHIEARPQGDYSLAVAWAGERLAKFENGSWTTGTLAPALGTARLSNIAFSDDGNRAIIMGAYEQSSGIAELREYRHGDYRTAGLTNISIPGFSLAPWLARNGIGIFDAVWRPGCDEGYMVGGCGSLGCSRGYLIAFNVQNGRQCN